MFLTLALLAHFAQDPAAVSIRAHLEPRAPSAGQSLRWSPKGSKVALEERDGALCGSFPLGPGGTPAVVVRLDRTADAAHFDVLFVDADRDGQLGDNERLVIEPHEQRGKWWSSFTSELAVPVAAGEGDNARTRPYPVSLWFVEDPQEPDAAPVLRWSRRGWHEGEVEIDGRPAFVLITEMQMDGVFDQRDAWGLARDRQALLAGSSTRLAGHTWLDGVAYRPVDIDPDGSSLAFEAFDPGITEAEEKAKADRTAVDRAAPRAAEPLAFGKDLPAALAAAKQNGKRVFVDFQTTWCGPCKTMDALVYTAAPVVDAAQDVIAVKLDGDDERELVKRYRVTAYPTMLLLASDGSEVRRAVGYRGVKDMVEFLRLDGERSP